MRWGRDVAACALVRPCGEQPFSLLGYSIMDGVLKEAGILQLNAVNNWTFGGVVKMWTYDTLD